MADAAERGARASGGEIAAVRIALGAIALHVLDGAFVDRQPGTAAADHLVSGVVPVAILACLAIAYPRLPAWWQAVLAGSVGVLAVVAAAGVSVRHVVAQGFSGDDATGLLAGLAGAALPGCATGSGT